MSLQIAVCVKSVPDPDRYKDIRLDPETGTLIRSGVPSVLNPADLHAIELAMQLKESAGGMVTLLSMGPQDAAKQLREGLSYGVDAAVLLTDRTFGGADSLATAYTLALGVRKTGPYDLILLGDESSDGATTHVPSQLGEELEMPHLTDVTSFALEEGGRTAVVKKRDGERILSYRLRFPAVVGVKKEINQVRIPNMKNIFAAKKKPLTQYTAADFPEADPELLGLRGSPTRNGEMHEVSFGRQATALMGSSEEIAAEIVKIITPILGLK